MPLQSIVSRDAFNSIDARAAAGNKQGATSSVTFVGQGVGLTDSVNPPGAPWCRNSRKICRGGRAHERMMEE